MWQGILQPEPTAILRSSDAGKPLRGKWIWTTCRKMTRNCRDDTERGLVEKESMIESLIGWRAWKEGCNSLKGLVISSARFWTFEHGSKHTHTDLNTCTAMSMHTQNAGLSLSSNNHITYDALFMTSGYMLAECMCVCAGHCCEIKQSNPKGMKHILCFILLPLFLFHSIKGQCNAPRV